MNVRELIAALNLVADKDREALVWLPGSRIEIAGIIGVFGDPKKPVLIEGNLREGSALMALLAED